MNIEIGPGRAGEPVLYIDNYPVAEVHDEDRMNAILQRLERYEIALKTISVFEGYDKIGDLELYELPSIAKEALEE